jgi:hypothetical protein
MFRLRNVIRFHATGQLVDLLAVNVHANIVRHEVKFSAVVIMYLTDNMIRK